MFRLMDGVRLLLLVGVGLATAQYGAQPYGPVPYGPAPYGPAPYGPTPYGPAQPNYGAPMMPGYGGYGVPPIYGNPSMGLLGPYGLPQFGYGGNVGYGGNSGYGGSVGYGGSSRDIDGDNDNWDSRGSGSYGMNQYPGYGSSYYGSDLSSILGGFTNPKDYGGAGSLATTKSKIDDYLAKTQQLGKRKLSVQVDYLNTPLEYQYLSQYHGFQHPLSGTPLGDYFNVPKPTAAPAQNQYSQPQYAGASQTQYAPPQPQYSQQPQYTQPQYSPPAQPQYAPPAQPQYSAQASYQPATNTTKY